MKISGLATVPMALLLTGCPLDSNSGSTASAPAAPTAAEDKCKEKKQKAKLAQDDAQDDNTSSDCVAEAPVATPSPTPSPTPSSRVTKEEVAAAASTVAANPEAISAAVNTASAEDVSILKEVVDRILNPSSTPKYALIALSADSHSFSGTLNTEGEFNLTITNSGEASTKSLSLASLAEPYRVISHNCGSSLAASASCIAKIGYKPTQNGVHGSSLAVSYNDGQESKSKSFSLNGITGPNVQGISPASSVATQSLTISGSNFSSQSDVKVGTAACPKTSVTASQIVCTLPAGSGSKVITVTDNARDSQFSNFTYLAPASLAISAASHDFGRIRKGNVASETTFTLTNNGGFTASGVAISAPSPFTLSTACANLAPGASCSVTVGYAPTQVRTDSAQLSVSYNSGEAASSVSADLSGQAIPRVVQVSFGNGIACMLYSEGNIKCIGRLSSLGNNSIGVENGYILDNQDTPASSNNWANATEVYGINNATKISVGNYAGCALLSDSTVKCWGAYKAEAAQNAIFTRPQTIQGVINAVDVKSVGEHVQISTTDGRLLTWGSYPGNNTAMSFSLVDASYIPSTYAITEHSYSANGICALTEGRLICWGMAVGHTNDNAPALVPTLVPGSNNSNLTKISAGLQFACAINASTQVLCFGKNELSQLGNDSASRTTELVNVINHNSQPISGFTSISTGINHACAIKQNGSLWCWGNNQFGQTGLGDQYGYGIESSYTKAYQVPGISNVVQVVAAAYMTMAITQNGDVYVWGAGGFLNGLNDDPNVATNRYYPVKINIE
jgi:alpha-tubulin suppressor-like RCC1 family protein